MNSWPIFQGANFKNCPYKSWVVHKLRWPPKVIQPLARRKPFRSPVLNHLLVSVFKRCKQCLRDPYKGEKNEMTSISFLTNLNNLKFFQQNTSPTAYTRHSLESGIHCEQDTLSKRLFVVFLISLYILYIFIYIFIYILIYIFIYIFIHIHVYMYMYIQYLAKVLGRLLKYKYMPLQLFQNSSIGSQSLSFILVGFF